MKATRSATARAACTRCSTRIVATPWLRSAFTVSRIVAIIAGISPSVGSSSSSTFGSRQSARATASISCSPPESVPERCCSRSRRTGKQRQHAVAGFLPVIARHQAKREILFHRQLGEQPAPLGHIGDAALRHFMGRQCGEICVVQHHPPRARPHQAHDCLQRRGLAGAVAAQQAQHLARREFERHAAQHLHMAVVAVDVVDAQRHVPR